ncbi:MAG TPA: dTMP kinase [Anaerolineales bacterium]|nr:dTMP kinase [Anaerolineales bacterium]
MSFFLSIEGPDGSGKTTQARLLADHLRQAGHDVLLAREPGGTPIGDQIRQVLFSLDNKGMSPESEFLLFSASRAQLVRQVLRPHLQRGGLVVCDRFADSSLAYQGYGHGLELEMVQAVTRLATGGLRPNLTVLLDLPAEDGLARRKQGGRWNRLDDYDLEFHQRVRQAFLGLAAADPARWVTVDGRPAVEEVQREIQRVVDPRLAARG